MTNDLPSGPPNDEIARAGGYRCSACTDFFSGNPRLDNVCPNCAAGVTQVENKPDKLEQIMKAQDDLRCMLLVKHGDKYPKSDEAHMAYMADCIIAEAMEMKSLTNWKLWKKPVDVNYELIREELNDIFTFVMNGYSILGMTPDEVLSYYMSKNKENRRRQEDGY